jgi:NAD(P)-dependent dehydrogenase (short-subunit alcohol dehydrogenase family)
MSLTATAKVFLITGASRGFGQLTAKSALERGDAVVATARQPTTMNGQWVSLPTSSPSDST